MESVSTHDTGSSGKLIQVIIAYYCLVVIPGSLNLTPAKGKFQPVAAEDVVTFASAMNACKSASAWKQSLALFADLDKWNLKANTVVTFHLPVQSRLCCFSCFGWEWDSLSKVFGH